MKLLYQQEKYPVFQNRMYASVADARACVTGDICLVEDEATGLVYNAAFDAALMVYDAQYQNEQALSGMFKDHLQDVLNIVARQMGAGTLVEVGCGKGHFMEMLLARGLNATGFDPAYEGHNPRIKKHYFDPQSAITAEGLVLRHVLEHIQNPVDFLSQLSRTNGGKGRIYIEVPCFDWICAHKAWFDVFYEHVNYFRLGDFERMFGVVLDSGKLFGGQYIYVVAELGTLRRPKADGADRVDFPADFTAAIGQGRPGSVIWGGASKGVIFSLLKERASQAVHAVVDINPAKQGNYLPSTGLLVQSPVAVLDTLSAGSSIYVMNSNYLDEIKHMSGNRFNYLTIDTL